MFSSSCLFASSRLFASPLRLLRQRDVSSTMYSFMKAARFTYLNLEGTECKIVYNHHRKTAKIGNGWRTFAQT
ncbi:hypothetical protein JHK86_050842 [Glycine max]|nr:hypothetical protein JHK86_050842 [Glycine max]